MAEGGKCLKHADSGVVQSAVDVHRGAGHVGGQVGRQIGTDAADFFRLAQALHRDGVDDAPVSYTHLTLPTSDLV